jgi:hypothetical protein
MQFFLMIFLYRINDKGNKMYRINDIKEEMILHSLCRINDINESMPSLMHVLLTSWLNHHQSVFVQCIDMDRAVPAAARSEEVITWLTCAPIQP